jgi:hypothetical protein
VLSAFRGWILGVVWAEWHTLNGNASVRNAPSGLTDTRLGLGGAGTENFKGGHCLAGREVPSARNHHARPCVAFGNYLSTGHSPLETSDRRSGTLLDAQTVMSSVLTLSACGYAGRRPDLQAWAWTGCTPAGSEAQDPPCGAQSGAHER